MGDQYPKQPGQPSPGRVLGKRPVVSPPRAAQAVLEVHGPGLFGFLIAALEEVETARVVYGQVCQRVGTEIEGFQDRCSLRAWVYGLARRELRDRRRRTPRELEARVGMADTIALGRAKGLTGAVATIRGTLTEEDRELLILRVDRGFDWQELAFTGLDERASPSSLAAESRILQARLEAICARVERVAARYRNRGAW